MYTEDCETTLSMKLTFHLIQSRRSDFTLYGLFK